MNNTYRKLTQRTLAISLIGALSVLGACAQAPVPEDHYYRLTPANTTSKSGVKLDGIIEVERFIADGLLDSRPILFTRSAQSTEIQSYHYHFWTQPPSILLQNALTAKLQQTNAANSIVTPDLRIEPDFILAGKIFRFEQITRQKNNENNKVIVSLELSLKNAKLDKLIHLNTYTVEVPSSNASVASAVTAFSTGIGQIIDAFLNDLNGKV